MIKNTDLLNDDMVKTSLMAKERRILAATNISKIPDVLTSKASGLNANRLALSKRGNIPNKALKKPFVGGLAKADKLSHSAAG